MPVQNGQPNQQTSSGGDPGRDLGKTDDLLNLLSTLFSGQSQQNLIRQGQKDYPGLNSFSDGFNTQHLASTALAAPKVGQALTGMGGGLVEILENLLQGTNTPDRPRAIEDTTLDFIANQLGANGSSPETTATMLNSLQGYLQNSSPEQQYAVQDQIAPIAGPLSRALVNPGSITTSPMEGLWDALRGPPQIPERMSEARPWNTGPKPIQALGGATQSIIDQLMQALGQ